MMNRIPLQPLPSLDQSTAVIVRRRAIFDCFKWDPQVEDVATLTMFPLVIDKRAWVELASAAEGLAQEVLAAEQELLKRPQLHEKLVLPKPIKALLKDAQPQAPACVATRVIRFDFHFTTEGWRISEANNDVPGGFNEGSGFTQIMAEHYRDFMPIDDPAGKLITKLLQSSDAISNVGFVHATSYTEDTQVMKYLAHRLEDYQVKTHLISPDQLTWLNGRAHLKNSYMNVEMDLLVRFFPADWMANLSRSCDWKHFFVGSQTPICNPAATILCQGKRFPLVWDELETPLPNWRKYLPETVDAGSVDWQRDKKWLLKPAWGRVGERISMPGITESKVALKIEKEVIKAPAQWIAQRRFETVPVIAEGKSYYPCIGVYTVDGKAAGIYARISESPIINNMAQDVAVLIERG